MYFILFVLLAKNKMAIQEALLQIVAKSGNCSGVSVAHFNHDDSDDDESAFLKSSFPLTCDQVSS